MTAEEYVKHYASGQGGFVSVSLDVALRAIEYAKQETKQQIVKGALDGRMVVGDEPQLVIPSLPTVTRTLDDGDKVKVIILKED